LPEKAVPEMTYSVSGGTLNPTHSLTQSQNFVILLITMLIVQYQEIQSSQSS